MPMKFPRSFQIIVECQQGDSGLDNTQTEKVVVMKPAAVERGCWKKLLSVDA